MSVDAKILPGAAERIDFSTWDFVSEDTDAGTALNDLVRRAATETIRGVLEGPGYFEAPVQAEFYWQWGVIDDPTHLDYPVPGHPLDIYIKLPLDNAINGSKPAWKVSFRDLVIDCIDNWDELNDDPTLQVTDTSLNHITRFVEALEAEAAFARKLLDNAKIVTEDGDAVVREGSAPC